MRVLFGIGGDIGSPIQAGGCSSRSGARGGGGEDAIVDMRCPGGLAVPAGAFAVDLATGELLVHFAGLSEALRELVLVDFVDVVDEYSRCLIDGEVVVAMGGELVRVPGEIHVQCGNGHASRVPCHDGEENPVLLDETVHHRGQGGRMYLVQLVHLLDEGALADDGSDEVEGKG